MTDALFVFGASGHGKVVIDAIECGKLGTIVALLDDAPERLGMDLLGYRVLGGRSALVKLGSGLRGIVAIGDNNARLHVASFLQVAGFSFLKVIHPAATVAASAQIGEGTLVMPHAVINADAWVGKHVIVNTAATIDHDCIVEDGVHLAPGVHLCGGAFIGRGAMLGAGTVVTPGVRIGSRAIIGAGSTVISDIPEAVRAAGSPCRILEEKS